MNASRSRATSVESLIDDDAGLGSIGEVPALKSQEVGRQVGRHVEVAELAARQLVNTPAILFRLIGPPQRFFIRDGNDEDFSGLPGIRNRTDPQMDWSVRRLAHRFIEVLGGVVRFIINRQQVLALSNLLSRLIE